MKQLWPSVERNEFARHRTEFITRGGGEGKVQFLSSFILNATKNQLKVERLRHNYV